MSAAVGVAEQEAHADTVMRAEGHTRTTDVVILLGATYANATADDLQPLLEVLGEAFGENISRAVVAYPVDNPEPSTWEAGGVALQPYSLVSHLPVFPVQTAASYVSLFEVVRAHSATCGLVLGAEAHTLQPAAIRVMVDTVMRGEADLMLARYSVGPNEGLINASMLHPVSRALFGVKAQFPLALDLAISARMAERAASSAQRFTASVQPDAIIWIASEAAVAGYTIAEAGVGTRELPHPPSSDLSLLLGTAASSLFSDVESKAAFWQRVRPPVHLLSVEAVPSQAVSTEPVESAEITNLITNFRNAYGNLYELWSLVLPPHTLLGLKRLSNAPPDQFILTDALWVRVVYDFVLAYRLRTINRTHLLGSFTPIYLAWVASHILQAKPSAVEDLARTFEADKPYLVSRWRWPDRFNP